MANNNDERHLLVVPERQQRIERINQEYQAMQAGDNDKKIKTLEVAGNILKVATTAVGVITVIDWIVPDPVLGIDEVALTALTTLLGTASTIVSNKKAQLESTGQATMSMEEVQKIAQQVGDARNKVAASRAQMKK